MHTPFATALGEARRWGTRTTVTIVERNEAQSRYDLVVDGRVIGFAEFRNANGTLIVPHTEIEPASRGRGHGETLVRGMLDDIRARGERVVPRCWFVAEFLDVHPEYADLRAAA
jgi:predicted GNAT family acetyltransferase